MISSLTSSKPLSGSAVKTFFSRAGIGFGIPSGGSGVPSSQMVVYLNVTDMESIRDSRNFTFLTRTVAQALFFPEKSFTRSFRQDMSLTVNVWKKKQRLCFRQTTRYLFQINELLYTTSHSPRYSSGRASANPSPSPSATLRQISLSVNPLRSRSEIKSKPTTQN